MEEWRSWKKDGAPGIFYWFKRKFEESGLKDNW
jgi:hypothetical protein